jgi:ComF family protein
MDVKELFNKALYYVSVPKCACCKEKLDYKERGLCKKCKEIYDAHKLRNCPKCSAILSECFCTYDFLDNHGIKNLVKIFRYSKADESMPSNYLIYSLKQDNRKDVISFLADEMSNAISRHLVGAKEEYLITNVPRRRKAIVNFGYDHAAKLALEVSKRLGIEYISLLKSKATDPQKSVYGQARIENARFEYKCKKDITLKGKTVILIDDIITTGSSVTNCATLIRGLHPRKIIAACLGTAYKEKGPDFRFSTF